MRNTKVHEAYDEGIKEKALETAKNLLNLGIDSISLEQIVECTGLSLEKVNKLKEELDKQSI